jgi:5S rRNA maturation endonuclease (ribonuclease M5)
MIRPSNINSIKQLANYLRCSEEFLSNLIEGQIEIRDYHRLEKYSLDVNSKFKKTDNIIAHIDKFSIPKKNAPTQYRVVYSVDSFELSNILKGLSTSLSEIYTHLDIVHGFVENRNIKTNANCHLTKKLLLSVDIKNFFESITSTMVEFAFRKMGFETSISEILASIVTISGHLVQGYNTSPLIANIVTENIDKELISLCANNITYTRYADDLYFSSDVQLPDLNQIEEIINKYDLKLNHDKTKLMKRGSQQYVTGLTIFDGKGPRIPKIIKRRLRLETHYIDKYGYEEHCIRRLNYTLEEYNNSPEIQTLVHKECSKTRHRIFGWLYFIKSIEPNFYQKLIYKINK